MTKTSLKQRSARAAFTLIEILLAIAMISLLAFMLVTNIEKTMSSGQSSIAKTFVRGSLSTPLMSYKLAIGRYPTTEEGLEALLRAPDEIKDRWNGPYLRDTSVPKDPWGNPYQYRSPAQKSSDGYDLWSNGPDGQSETDDDIGNW